MPLITENIPAQGFEVVRDAIGAILKDEIENQKSLKGICQNTEVFVGRSTPFQHAEVVMINVLFDGFNTSNFHEQGVHETAIYYVDLYVSAKETVQKDGGYNATALRDFYMGMIRYILQDHHYCRLGLLNNGIMGTYVDSLENFEPVNAQDSAFVKMGRLTFRVRINETQSLWEGVLVQDSFTDVKLDLTDKGYKFELVN